MNKTTSGIVILSGANTYTGGTTIGAGTLSISSDANLGPGTVTMSAGTTLALLLRRSHRALRSRSAAPRSKIPRGVQAWEAAGCPPGGKRPGDGDVIAHFASGEAIVRYEPAPPMAGTTGDIEALSLWAGQDVALARKSQSAADIVAELTSRL